MGAMIFAMTDRGETAGDLAEQSGHNEQIVTILRAAEGMCLFVGIRCCYCELFVDNKLIGSLWIYYIIPT